MHLLFLSFVEGCLIFKVWFIVVQIHCTLIVRSLGSDFGLIIFDYVCRLKLLIIVDGGLSSWFDQTFVNAVLIHLIYRLRLNLSWFFFLFFRLIGLVDIIIITLLLIRLVRVSIGLVITAILLALANFCLPYDVLESAIQRIGFNLLWLLVLHRFDVFKFKIYSLFKYRVSIYWNARHIIVNVGRIMVLIAA